MPRIVRHHRTDPIRINPAAPPGAPDAWPRDEQGNLKPILICACGISARFPFCDGAHKTCREEQPDCLYTYDIQTRSVVDKKPLDSPAAP